MKLWRQNYKINKQIEKFTVKNDYILDMKLVKYDCIASIAHVKMLKEIGILNKVEENKLIEALLCIKELDSKKKFKIKREEEDCHTAIENYLIEKLGDVGKKIHTARSRNDQVLTALRLYYKHEMKCVIKNLNDLIKTLIVFKGKYGNIEFPGYTHMRKAMSSSIGLWCDAFIESMNDNKKLLNNINGLIDQSPLGTGAGYDLPIEVDRKMTAQLLGFSKIQKNPIYVQNSRGKFESSIIHGLTQILVDLNKMSADIIFFSIPEIGYINLSPEISTGSSIMPHKKNPDVLEIIRANYHKLTSFEFEIKSIISNLISGYNRDLQLTKEPMMKGFEITKECLLVMKTVIEQISVDEKKCKKALTEELYSTNSVYKLVKQGVPFRDAYKNIAEKLQEF
jgi:argininosuccinate lyase